MDQSQMSQPSAFATATTSNDRTMRLALTRARDESERLAAILLDRGFRCVITPVVKIVHLPVHPAEISGHQAILLTSGNAVEAMTTWNADRTLPVLCVGDATTTLARAAGYRDVRSAAGAVRDLAQLTADALAPGAGSLLYLSGDPVTGDLTGLLTAKGFTVQRQVVYRAEPMPALDPVAAGYFAARAVDGVLLYSPRSARLFASLLKRAGLGWATRSMTAYCISDAVAAAAPDWQAIVVAARPTQTDLLALLPKS